LLTKTKDNSLSYKDFYGYVKDSRQLKKNWRQERWENPPSFIDNFSGIKKIGDLEEDLYVPYPAVSAVLRGVWLPEPESLAKEYFWSVGKKGPNEVICGAKSKEEGGEKEVEMDKELTNQEEELEAGEVFVLRRYFSRYFKRCAQGGVGTD
ncbi:hypothetical protein L249_7108, partial [Ophiocordyceps polyrhachis-furcata BCC 54312]